MNLTNEEYIEHSKDKEIDRLRVSNDMLRAENAKLRELGKKYELVIVDYRSEVAKLRELARGLHMAYVGALNEAEGMDAGLICEHCEMVDAELAKSHARFEADRHRFDVAMREPGVEVDG